MGIRISDIAKLAGVSTGTVDRVIHKRGRVSANKQEKVERALKELNYKPNMAARFLASNRRYTIKVVIPSYQNNEYWNCLNDGIIKAKNEIENFEINVEYLCFDQSDSSTFPISDELFSDDCAGVIIGAIFHKQAEELSQILDEKEIPYVYVDNNISGQNNEAFFGVDSFVGGAIAARFMMSEIAIDGEIVIVNIERRHNNTSTQKETRELGFSDYLSKNNFRGKVHRIEMLEKRENESTEQLIKLVEGKRNKIGAVVFNSKIYKLARIVEDAPQLKDEIVLIGYDLIPSNIDGVNKDLIKYIISQRPFMQGYESVKCLSNLLVFGVESQKENYMPIDIIIKENLNFYNNYKL